MKIIKNTLIILALGSTSIYAGDILATVNGKNITIKDAQRYVAAANPQQPYSSLGKEDKKMITQRLIERVLFIDAAKSSGIENDDKFKTDLNVAKNELMIRHWMKKQHDSAVVSNSEAKEFYKKNSARYQIPAKVHARHILLKKDEIQAKKIIDELKDLKGEKLKNKFIEIAKEKSEGPSKTKGGDLGYFAPKQMVAPFDKVVFALKKGTISKEPVKTQFGYHIIYVEDKKAPKTIPYKDVKSQIVETLKQIQFGKMIEKTLKELKSKAEITIKSK